METYVLYRGNKRITLKEDDMRVDRIARIFQVSMASLYITDSANVAIFPIESGCFSSLDLSTGGHYEVHGEVEDSVGTPTDPAPWRQFAFRRNVSQPVTTANMSMLSRSVSTPRSIQRSIHVSEIMEGKLVSTRLVIVRLNEAEASVSAIQEKLKVAMGGEDDYILTDTLGNEIVESEGTTGSLYWRQNARKIHAIEKNAFRQWRRRRSSSRNDHVQMLRDNVEELLEACQGLEEVSRKITDLVSISRDVVWPEIKQAFVCLICRAIMTRPMFSSCCRTLVGCKVCVEEWEKTSDHCLKCRNVLPTYTEVAGLSAAMDSLRPLP